MTEQSGQPSGVHDLPATRLAPQAPAARSFSAQPRPLSGRFAPPLIAVLAGIGITTAVLVNVTHGRWGFIWLLVPVLLIARRLSCYPCAPGAAAKRTEPR
jgi:hypothetical protein